MQAQSYDGQAHRTRRCLGDIAIGTMPTLAQSNPWDTNVEAWGDFGGAHALLDAGLLLDDANIDGEVAHSQVGYRGSHSDTLDGDGLVNPSSLQLLDILDRMDAADAAVEKLTTECEVGRAEVEFADLTHAAPIDAKLDMLRRVTSFCRRVVDNAGALASELQKPYAAVAIPVEYAHHKEFIKLFSDLPGAMLAHPEHMEVVHWAGEFDSGSVPLEKRVQLVTGVLARYRTFLESLQTLRSCLRVVQELRGPKGF